MLEVRRGGNIMTTNSDFLYQQIMNDIKYWKTKDGKIIRISDMTTTHIINTIKMLRRQIDGSIHDDFVYDYVDAMQKELKRRGIRYE